MLNTQKSLRGINLGGWLVLEEWITPSLFEGTSAHNEWSLGEAKGEQLMRELLNKHRESFIRDSDIAWVAKAGFDVVRLPIGYWALKDQDGFYACTGYVERLLEWASNYQLGVILDLHAAPGSQNGWDHSGRAGRLGWHVDKSHIDATVSIVEKIAQIYGSHQALYGIEILNEPRWDVPLDVLMGYYKRAIERIRMYANQEVKIIVSDSFRTKEVTEKLKRMGLSGVMIDTHLYQVFDDADRRLDMNGHLAKVQQWQKELQEVRDDFEVLVGEWSAALDPQTFTGMELDEKGAITQSYFEAQREVFDEVATAWCYWTYKTEQPTRWSFKDQPTFYS